jgi:hypothetical protein
MSPYEVLEVAPGATEDEVRRAWRRRAFETHPDRGGDEAAFDVVRQAFAHLCTRPAGQHGAAPVLVRRLGAGASALRWYRRRRDRDIRPRVH